MNSLQDNQGIQGHSQPHWYNAYMIIAVPTADIDKFKSWAEGAQIGCKQLVGYYEGLVETSFIINRDVPLAYLQGLADFTKSQAAILILEKGVYLGGGDWYRPCYLQYADRKGPMMRWRQVHKDYALEQLAYTYDATQNAYFVAEVEQHKGAVN